MEKKKSKNTGARFKNIQNNTKQPDKMWRADNNGQIAQNNTSNSIGKWAIANVNEKGNGENFYKTLEANNLRCMNTFFTPPQNKPQNIDTWNNYGGAQNKQIDFFAISNINKNWVTNAPNKHTANPHFVMRQKTLKISIKLISKLQKHHQRCGCAI